MSDTFDATTGDLYAVYATDLDEKINYVDALYWISEDGTDAYYIIGNEAFTTDTDEFEEHDLFEIPHEAKKSVVNTMVMLEGNSPRNFHEQLNLLDVVEIIREAAK